MKQPEGTELTKLHFPAVWTSQSATNFRASVSGGWERTIATATLHWDDITDSREKIRFSNVCLFDV